MKFRVINRINVQKILTDRHLGPNIHEAAMFLASTVKRLSDPYVPMQQGVLKNTAQVVRAGKSAYLIYNQPYAHYQYHGMVMGPNVLIPNVGWRSMAPVGGKHYTGKELTYSGAPMRGKEWDKRMMIDRGDEVTKDLAAFVGGKAK